MRLFVRENKVLLILIVLAVLISAVTVSGRISVESKAKAYDVVLDYQEFSDMADQSDESLTWWFQQFEEMGINKVGLLEESLNTLVQTDLPVSSDMMSKIMEKADWQKSFPADFVAQLDSFGADEYDVMVEAKSSEIFSFIANAMKDRYEAEKYLIYPDADGGYILIDGTAKDALYTAVTKDVDSKGDGFAQHDKVTGSKLMYLNLGLWPEKVKEIQDAGMEVIPRTSGYSGWNDWKFADAVVKGYEQLNSVPEYMIFGGEQTIGFDEGVGHIQKYLEDNDITVGLIETTNQLQNIMQKGLGDLVIGTDYNAARVFSVWDYIQSRYQYYGYQGSEEIENTLYRAITERNVRIVYFKPMKEKDDNHVFITNAEDYKEMFTNLNERLAEHKIVMGKASVMEPTFVSLLAKAGMTVGSVAGAVLLLSALWPIPRKWKYTLLGAGVVCALGAYFVVPNLATLLGTFAAAVVFPCMATVLIVKQSEEMRHTLSVDTKVQKILGIAVLTLIGAVAISLCGAVMTAAPMSDINHMLEIDIFRGVKAAQLIPLGFFLLVYMAYYGFGHGKENPGRLESRDFLQMLCCDIKVWMVLLAAIVGGVGAYYLMRTGNSSDVTPSTIEMLLRNVLEEGLLARPRSKEFFFAFPCVMLLLYSSVRKLRLWPVIFGLGSVIGLTSVVNTFMHMRTPLYMGFARTGFSLLFGIVIGIVAVIAFDICYKVYKKIERQIA